MGDITDINFVFELLNFSIDYVLHVAALIDISLSYEKIAKVNVESVKYLFQASRLNRVKRFVFVSSGSIYKTSNMNGICSIKIFLIYFIIVYIQKKKNRCDK